MTRADRRPGARADRRWQYPANAAEAGGAARRSAPLTSPRPSAASITARASPGAMSRRQSMTTRAGTKYGTPRSIQRWACGVEPRWKRRQSSGFEVRRSSSRVMVARGGGLVGMGRLRRAAALAWLTMASGVTRAAVRARARWRSHAVRASHADATAYRPGATRVRGPALAARSNTRALTPLERHSERANGCGRWVNGIPHRGLPTRDLASVGRAAVDNPTLRHPSGQPSPDPLRFAHL